MNILILFSFTLIKHTNYRRESWNWPFWRCCLPALSNSRDSLSCSWWTMTTIAWISSCDTCRPTYRFLSWHLFFSFQWFIHSRFNEIYSFISVTPLFRFCDYCLFISVNNVMLHKLMDSLFSHIYSFILVTHWLTHP